jgi:hypothetical protein
MTRTCACCGRQFKIIRGLAKDYAYKDKDGYYCSYSCKIGKPQLDNQETNKEIKKDHEEAM